MAYSSEILQASILIVDDQDANIALLERMLRAEGYISVASTGNPNAVCELHRKHHYDLILLDLLMPNVAFSGFQVMEELKEIESGSYLPVIVISAHPDFKLRALQAGARDFISKPFEQPEMLARVYNMLEIRLLHVRTKNHLNVLEQKLQELEANWHNDSFEAAMSHVPSPTRTHTLLYIEDRPESQQLVAQIIARMPDIHLLNAMDGMSGIEIARTSRPDVILLDINLPGIDGFETLKILRADPGTKDIPVIAISANAMPRVIERAKLAGFCRYITKPLKVDELIEAMNFALVPAPTTSTANVRPS